MAYREEMDVLAAFFNECCVVDKMAQVGKTELYEAYREWRQENGERTESQRKFGKRLIERGFSEDKTTGGRRVWYGIGLQESGRSGTSGAKVGMNDDFYRKTRGDTENCATCATEQEDEETF